MGRRLQRHREGISLKGRGNSRENFRYFWLIFVFFCLVAARVRVPGRSPFSQLFLADLNSDLYIPKIHDGFAMNPVHLGNFIGRTF